MKLSKLAMVGLAVGSIGYVTYAFAAGLWPNFPIVGGATYCAGSSSSATGSIIGLVTGCPNQVPAGPAALTGTEHFPADTGLASGINPQTVLVTPASLNALPNTYVTVLHASPANLSATNLQGCVIYLATETITALNVSLPPSPIEGQQFCLNANFTITTLVVGAANQATQTLNAGNPTVLTASTTVPQGYRWVWRNSTNSWFRLQ